MAFDGILRLLDWALRTPWLLWLLGLFTISVTTWGFVEYYGPQFEWIHAATGSSEWWVYPFVPDCPLFGMVFVVVLGLRRLGFYNNTVAAFVAVGNIKYGLWTVFVLLYYFDRFFGPQSGEVVLRGVILALHVGMVPLGLLLWRGLSPLRAYQYVLVFAGQLLYDYFDYAYTDRYQVYPIGLPSAGYGVPVPASSLGLVPIVTVLESVVLVGLLAWSFRTPFPTGRSGARPTAQADPSTIP